jgi:O-antigen/teichoic acid export membrane protein
LTTILQVALVFLSFNLFGALIGFVGGFLVSSLIGAAMLSIKFIRPLKTKINPSLNQSGRQVMGLLAQYGMPVYVSVVLTGLFPLYQQIVLAFFTTDVAIGNFRAAYNFVTLLAVVSISIMTALLPAFAKLENSLPETISAFFNKANKYTCLLLVPLTTVVIVLSQPIVQLLYGSIYTSAALFLSLNCSVYLLAIIGYMTLTSLFNGLGMTRLTLNTTLISFTILLILSPILAQYFDVAGAIIAYLVAVTVATSYAANIAVRKVKIKFSFKPTLSIFAISLIASIIPVALMFLTSLNSVIVLVIGGVSFVFVFITLVPVFGVISNGELTVIESMVQRIPVLKKIAKLLIIYARKIMVLFHKQL